MIEILDTISWGLLYGLMIGTLCWVTCHFIIDRYSLSMKVEQAINKAYNHYQAYNILHTWLSKNKFIAEMTPYINDVSDMRDREMVHINNLVRIFNDNRPFWRSEIEIIFEAKK